MAEYAKRPEVTVCTMGKVHNPTGEGVRAISAQVQAKAVKVLEKANNNNNCSEEFSAGSKKFTAAATVSTSTTSSSSQQHHSDGLQQQHETKTKEGTAKRNITRKKTADKDTGNFNSCFKKQGGAGKAQWQQDKDEEISNYYVQAADMEAVDEKDPMYDVAQDLNQYILTSHAPIPPSLSSQPTTATPPSAGGASSASDQKRGTDPCTSKAVYGPLWTVTEFKLRLAECIREYFDSCDTDEVIRTISELKCREYHATEIVKKTISLAMDQGPRERELTSRLLTCLHPNPMSRLELQVGFGMLLDSMDELCKDVPDAKTMAASFLARAVVDEVLPPAYLSEQNNDRPGDVVIEKAVSLLSREHCNARLERVWGPGDGRPVEELKVDMDQLLQEYLLSSRELDEAARCVNELQAPHFHHELVKRGVFAAMEIDGKGAAAAADEEKTPDGTTVAVTAASDSTTNDSALSNIDAMAALFGFLVRNAIVSDNQIKKGVDRLHQLLPDISLDVPAAPSLLEAFEKMAKEEGCLVSATATTSNTSS